MQSKLKLSAGAAALALLIAAGASPVKAADIVAEPGCMLSGSVTAGYMFDWQSSDGVDEGDDVNGKDVDWQAPFGEGAGLVTCGGLNIQADVAYYAHSAEIDGDDVDIDQTNTHIGGALFYRDPASWAGGLQASWISQDVFAKDVDVFRVGLFGEFYLDDMFTLGASAAYYDSDGLEDFIGGWDEDGFELAAWARFYATEDFSLLLRGDVLLADVDAGDEDADLTGFAITGEAEFLVWDQGLSVLGGARYAERELEVDADDSEFTIEDFQVFAGIKFYFGADGTLVERQRTGTIDNTSVFNEKLPNFLVSGQLAFAN